MIIVNTNLKKLNTTDTNSYICPHCNRLLKFNKYISVSCSKCSKSIFNIEKLLSRYSNTNKLNYYIDEKI